jgi:lipoprotein-releasing system permease protein
LVLANTNFIQLPADVYYIDHLPIRIDPMDIGLVVLAAVLIVVLATLLPANRATKIDPVEAIRYG